MLFWTTDQKLDFLQCADFPEWRTKPANRAKMPFGMPSELNHFFDYPNPTFEDQVTCSVGSKIKDTAWRPSFLYKPAMTCQMCKNHRKEKARFVMFRCWNCDLVICKECRGPHPKIPDRLQRRDHADVWKTGKITFHKVADKSYTSEWLDMATMKEKVDRAFEDIPEEAKRERKVPPRLPW